MEQVLHDASLKLIDDFVAEGRQHFTFQQAQQKLGLSRSAASNLLRRMRETGLIDRVRYGRYAVRNFGVLGTPSAAEDIALAVGAAFSGVLHRMAYRTALDEHDLITHPARTIQVATASQIRAKSLSSMPLRLVREPEASISIGAFAYGESWLSDIERALLDAAARPKLVGGLATLAEAIAAANEVDVMKMTGYAKALGWEQAIRRIGSIADALEIGNLAGQLKPIGPITADLDLEPGVRGARTWRDSRWHMRWPIEVNELAHVVSR